MSLSGFHAAAWALNQLLLLDMRWLLRKVGVNSMGSISLLSN